MEGVAVDPVFHSTWFLSFLLPWKFPSISMETSTYFHGGKSNYMEGFTNFDISKFVSMKVSMEVNWK